MISAADHECGGLVAGGAFTGAPEYGWLPEAVQAASHTSSYLASQITKYKGDDLSGCVS